MKKYKVVGYCKKCGLPNRIEVFESIDLTELPNYCVCACKR